MAQPDPSVPPALPAPVSAIASVPALPVDQDADFSTLFGVVDQELVRVLRRAIKSMGSKKVREIFSGLSVSPECSVRSMPLHSFEVVGPPVPDALQEAVRDAFHLPAGVVVLSAIANADGVVMTWGFLGVPEYDAEQAEPLH